MTIIRLIFAAALASFAVANVDEVSNDAETFAEATAFVQSFSSKNAQGDSSCEKVADDAIKAIVDSCTTLQGLIDIEAKASQKCCKSGSVATCSAKGQRANAGKAHSTCLSQLATIQKKNVKLGTVSYSSLAGKTCYNYNSNSEFQAIKSEVATKTAECNQKKGSIASAKETYDNAVKAAASSRTTCNEVAQKLLTDTFNKAKASCGSASNLKAFTRAEHMKCVLKGTTLADCSKNMPKPPAVKETTLSTLNCSAQTGDASQCEQGEEGAADNSEQSGQCREMVNWSTWKTSTCKDQGFCGFRIQHSGKLGFLYAAPGTMWKKGKENYGCPTGWHWGTKKEYMPNCQRWAGFDEDNDLNGANMCGCRGYTCADKSEVTRFRFSDSHIGACSFAYMGDEECSLGRRGQPEHMSCSEDKFAGIICIKNHVGGRE